MSRTKHTPGPWSADGYNVRVKAGRHIAYTGPNHTPPHEYPIQCKREDEANAQLIAAAPCLLAALERLVDCIQETRGIDATEALHEAQAAIAKATGEST